MYISRLLHYLATAHVTWKGIIGEDALGQSYDPVVYPDAQGYWARLVDRMYEWCSFIRGKLLYCAML